VKKIMRAPSIILRDDILGREMVFRDPVEIVRADEPHEVRPALDRLEAARRAGKWCAGYLSYEAAYAFEPKLERVIPLDRRVPLVMMGVFAEPGRRTVGPMRPGEAALRNPRPAWTFEAYAERFARLRQHLRQGDCYQANLTFPISAEWGGEPAALFDAMTALQPVHHAALVDLGGPMILSRSPELFFEIDAAGFIQSRPMKGTVRRGATPREDAELAEFLRNDEKNRTENRMIVDLLRNDISRITVPGTLDVPELFRIESYPTVHQMVSRVRAKLEPGTTVRAIFEALFPCGSVTGVPKLRAMQILTELEGRPRDAYCGSIGWIAPTGEMRFNVAIRTVTLHEGGEAVFNVGGGIIFDSEARAEYEECLLKARFATGKVPALA
jgi:para-aminobenzoate synthetase component 1